MKELSILLPVYNSEKTIEKCINSILSSTQTNFELIIVNDGSNDSSKDKILSFGDNRIKYFEKKNTGLIDSLNFGIKNCSSEIIMRIDSDDYISPEKISFQLEALKSSNSVLVGSNAYIIDNDDNIIGETNLPLSHSEIVKSMIKIRPSLIHPSIITYKEILKRVNYYDDKYIHAEDYDLFLRISRLGKISNLPQKLMFLRKGENNISHKNAKKQIVNSLISRENFLINKDYRRTADKDYFTLSQKIKNSFFKSIFIFLHTKIIALEFIHPKSRPTIKLILLKIARRFLNFFL